MRQPAPCQVTIPYLLIMRDLLYPASRTRPEETTPLPDLSSDGTSPLKYQRLLRGWSQRKVAEALDTDETMISRWECGARRPTPFYREKLCALYGVTADRLGLLHGENSSLKRYRLLRGWSQRRLAEEIDTNIDTVSKWERGVNLPDPFFREKLCHLYGVTADLLGLM